MGLAVSLIGSEVTEKQEIALLTDRFLYIDML